MVIEDVLGRRREAKVYPDTSYNCPFCMAGVEAGSPAHAARACPNPACFARGGAGMPRYPLERAKAELEAAAEREREKQQRTDLEEWRRKHEADRRREESDRLDAIRVEALARGACVPCAIDSARYGRAPKYTKHRKGCPRG